MTRTRTAAPRPRAAVPPEPGRVADGLAGPGRHRDPVAAMAQDVAEIVGAGGGVDEPALVCRGWTSAEIAAHAPAAIARAQHRGAVPA